jgi:murein DD-endopeptidase MepM/ murein hydrolase activator NlpD
MKKQIVFGLLIILLVSCSGNSSLEETIQAETKRIEIPTAVTSPMVEQPRIISTSTAAVEPEPTPTEVVKQSQVCGLFAGEGLEALMQRLTNPFYRPEPGSDNPHQGVDFSDLDPVNRIALSGKAVQAITSGKVAMVITDRFPYGNAVLIETPLDALPQSWLQKISVNQPVEREIFHTNLTCPGDWENPGGDINQASFYILYAHFEDKVSYQVGETIECGQEIGKIGMSGNALAPHVHVEMRLGPSGATFEDMSHYDSSASLLAMENYCRWRVSGWYELLDPMDFFLIQ